jgi:imidazolonepropionase-like amidohydrolase
MERRMNELRARCSEEEKEALELIARYESMKPTEALRAIVREAAKKRGLWPIDNNGSSS